MVEEIADKLGTIWEGVTFLGVRVRVSASQWEKITTLKHPVMKGREASVQRALASPSIIRQSRTDPQVYLYYHPDGPYHVCVVVKHLTTAEGFIITAYRTDRIKEGEQVWPA